MKMFPFLKSKNKNIKNLLQLRETAEKLPVERHRLVVFPPWPGKHAAVPLCPM